MILFVVNLRSGNGRGERVWRTVENELNRRNITFAKIVGASSEEALRQAEDIIRNQPVRAVAAVGGDGTLHSILPLAIEYNLPIGVIPCGSGNDTALAFRLPKDPVAALDVLLAGDAQPADYMKTWRDDSDSHPSLISVAIGLDGAVAEDVNGSRYKKWCNRLGAGPLAYIIGLIRMLAVYRPQTMTITIDGVRREIPNAWLTAVANLPTYGGGLKICPDARSDDGLLHVCVVHDCTVLQLLRVFPTVLRGSHVRSRFVTMLSGQEVTVEAPEPLLAYGDGEPAGTTPLRAEIVPGQLLFLTSSG
ncbi:diacylglycerol/lipid kinase family protein [Cohnella pontilimi]|uniref:diacylglycerol/lipid kinase family protein n=1 Tax=Cohnella pontilimi TaxID=2564100 RepID=UPI00145C3FAD|nr:diacylglycerol kinase family protein [Cohnella pontilimi]